MAARGHVGAHLAASGRMPAHTHAHTTPATRAPTTCAKKRAHERAAPSRPSRMRRPSLEQLRPPHVHLWPARRPPRAAPRRCSPSPPRRSIRRERPHGCRRCRRCRRAARLCAYHGLCRRQGTCVRIEPPTLQPPRPASGGSRMAERRPRAPSGAAREAGWRRANVGGWWRSRADEMPWRMIRDTSSSREIDGPAHARAVRGVEVMGSEDNKHEEQGRMRGKGRERG